jgi:hypothetical protein
MSVIDITRKLSTFHIERLSSSSPTTRFTSLMRIRLLVDSCLEKARTHDRSPINLPFTVH